MIYPISLIIEFIQSVDDLRDNFSHWPALWQYRSDGTGVTATLYPVDGTTTF